MGGGKGRGKLLRRHVIWNGYSETGGGIGVIAVTFSLFSGTADLFWSSSQGDHPEFIVPSAQ